MSRCLSILVLLLVSVGSTSCECWFRHCKNTIEIVADEDVDTKVDVVGVPRTDVEEFRGISAYDWWNAPKSFRARKRGRVQIETFFVSGGTGTARGGATLEFKGENRSVQTGGIFVFADFPPVRAAAEGEGEVADNGKLEFTEEELDNSAVLRVKVTKDSLLRQGTPR